MQTVEVSDVEKRAFFDTMHRLSIDPKDFAVAAICQMRTWWEDWDKSLLARFGQSFFTSEICDFLTEESVEAYLGFMHALVDENGREMAAELVAFARRYGSHFYINIPSLKEAASRMGVDSTVDEWLLAYLGRIPTVILTAYDVGAYLQYLSALPRCIVLSSLLTSITDNIVVPIIINTLFDTEGSLSDVIVVRGGNSPPFDRRAAAENLVELAIAVCRGEIEVDIDEILLRYTGGLEDLGAVVCCGVHDFVILHEYSHVVLNHGTDAGSAEQEVCADMLALNVLLNHEAAKKVRLMSTERGAPFLAARASGPVILFEFLTLLNCVRRELCDTIHPFPYLRAAYLGVTAGLILQKNPRALLSFRLLLGGVQDLFALAHSMLGTSDDISSRRLMDTLPAVKLRAVHNIPINDT